MPGLDSPEPFSPPGVTRSVTCCPSEADAAGVLLSVGEGSASVGASELGMPPGALGALSPGVGENVEDGIALGASSPLEQLLTPRANAVPTRRHARSLEWRPTRASREVGRVFMIAFRCG
jgi:hypothetical protein